MGTMQNKPDCFDLWMFSQRDDVISFSLFNGTKHKKAAFFACAELQILRSTVVRFSF